MNEITKFLTVNAELVNSLFSKILHFRIRTSNRELDELLNKYADKFLVLTAEFFDTVFGPRQLFRQVVLLVILQCSVMASSSFISIFGRFAQTLTARGRKHRQLREKMKLSTSFTEWMEYAEQLDHLNNFDKWRKDDSSPLYDSRILKKRCNDIRQFIKSGNAFSLMFRLRGGLSREQFGMVHEGLFSKAVAGTKDIVQDYHDTVCEALNFIADTDSPDVPTDAKLAFFNETRHAYGRTGLLLSGGAYLGYYHTGLVKTLILQGLLPRVISGASAGSLIATLIGTRTDEEFLMALERREIRTDFFRFDTKRKKGGWAARLQLWMPQSLRWIGGAVMGYLFDRQSLIKLDTDHFKTVVQHNVGHSTFQEAFDKTGRIVNVTVAPLNHYDPPRLLNYLTAPHVCVWSAAVASCAIPGVFESSSLVVKEPNGVFAPEHEWANLKSGQAIQENLDRRRKSYLDLTALTGKVISTEGDTIPADWDDYKFSDGSMESDLPMQQLSELFNVNHFIVSQVNPHSFLFDTFAGKRAGYFWVFPVYGLMTSCLKFLKSECLEWFKNFIDWMSSNNVPLWGQKRGLTQWMTQEYEGRSTDINISPWAQHISVWTAMSRLLKNPSPEEFDEVLFAGQNATYPIIPRTRAHCLVEMTLDNCVQRLRRRLALENEDGESVVSAEEKTVEAPQESEPEQDSSVRRRTVKDRTPSFYTTRSILNLSGLSVGDRNPEEGTWVQPKPTPRLPESAKTSPSGKPSIPSLSSVFPTTRGSRSPSPKPLESARVGMDDEDDNPNDYSDLYVTASYDVGDNLDKDGRHVNLHSDRPGMKKSTSMSNFYYKNAVYE